MMLNFFPEPVGVEQGGVDGNLPLLFALVIIGHGGAVGDAAEASDHPAAGQHGLAEHGLAARCVAADDKTANVR